HLGLDPSYVAAMIVVRLQGIVGREVDPNEFAVISVGSLIAGHTNNTIPSEAKLVLNCRFYSTEVRDRTYKAIERVIRAECLASGDLTDNNPELSRTARPYSAEASGSQSQDSDRWPASEASSEIPRHFGCPYLFWTVGVTPTEQWDAATPPPANHASDFAP